MVRCCGLTLSASPRVLEEFYGPAGRLVTVWQLDGLPDGHVWLMPRRSTVSIGVMGVPGGEPATADRAAQAAPRPPAKPKSASRAPQSTASGQAADLIDRLLGELRFLNALPAGLGEPTGPAHTWALPLAAALDIESHVAKRSLAVGLAGGFVAALSGQWLYPSARVAALAGSVAAKALPADQPQDVLAGFSARWRGELSDFLRSPNTRLSFLLPLVFSNQQIADRFARAYLFGENF